MRPLHCEGCGMKAVLHTVSTRGPGGPTLYLCGVCAELGGAFVEAVKEGEPRMTALLLLKIHAKLSRVYDARFVRFADESPPPRECDHCGEPTVEGATYCPPCIEAGER